MHTTASPRPLLPDPEHELTTDEVRLLWSFVHGDIMDGGTRASLRRSWGLCRRHAWGHAVVEIELWQAGAGSHEGHQPFDVAVLLEDLMQQAVAATGSTHPRKVQHALRSDGECPVCRDLDGERPAGPAMGYANSDSVALTAEANTLEHTTVWLRGTKTTWADAVCPECARAAGGVVSPAGFTCRLHLLGREHLDEPHIRAVRAGLDPLPERLGRLTRSMTQAGADTAPEDDASWVVALGWLSGWDFPLACA